MTKQYGFVVDVSRCTGCRTCAVACKDAHNLPVGLNLRRVLEEASGSWRQDRMTGAWHQDVRAWYVSIACNHCENPACVKVCPTKAHYKRAEDGLVVIDRDKCIGCGMCAQACPYGAPQLDEKARKMMKCDGCLDRLEKGGAPTCVEACPQRAISFGEISELRRTFGTLAVTPPLPDPAQTRPALVIRWSAPKGHRTPETIHAELDKRAKKEDSSGTFVG